ncbi:hypothetical protein C9J01_15000 [Photobacterium rosenbergii]|uniref:Capsular biosynthesis protein n=1 Tax=Photobacterium rosenbergii TaxID=294936 RepID=A0A2T3NCQ4_9GAMM|nr:capsular polysaccharide synthesis protein [Photobacterium rosenbergii]PSW11828.1 hypothetical protein C9J01_15000 [Photobacterium rosenbergii]
MGSISRRIKECLRVAKCKFKAKKLLSTQEREKANYALSQVSKPVERGCFSKTIWMFWDSGLEHAPDVVKLSYRSWVKFNPDYDVVLLDKHNIRSIFGFDFYDVFKLCSVELGAAGKSDLLRLFLLNRFGGVWADATTFCKKPLSDWLELSDTGFFSFREKKADDRTLVSWFLASTQGHPITQSLLDESLRYLLKERPVDLDIVGLKTTKLIAGSKELLSKSGSGFNLLDKMEQKYSAPYFWMFYLFNEVVKREAHKQVWHDVQLMTNCYAELDDSYSEFIDSFVAKQTYRDKYVSQPLYHQREKYMLELLAHLK